jgi:hypothetical protein
VTLPAITPQVAASYANGRYLEHPTTRNRIAAEVKCRLAGIPSPSAPVPRREAKARD